MPLAFGLSGRCTLSRILVAGAGALGSVCGGFLRASGHDVTFLGRVSHMEAVARGGLTIDGIWGDHHVAGLRCATDARALRGSFDVILVTVKSFDTETVAGAVAPLLAADGIAISMQNGLGNVELLEKAAGAERSVGARVIFGSVLVAPGHARVTVFAEPVLVGAWEPDTFPRRDAAARRWAAALDESGVPAEYTDRLQTALWAKAFYNAALNPLGALLGVHYGALAESESTRGIMDAVIAEGYAVAQREGVALPWPDPAAYRDLFYSKLVPSTYDHRSSMLQDLERGRRTEIEAINGAVWRRGEAHGMTTPYNETLTRLIRYREGRR